MRPRQSESRVHFANIADLAANLFYLVTGDL